MVLIQLMVVLVLILLLSTMMDYGVSPTTGDDATITLDIYHTNIEKITVVDLATDDDHDVTININAAWTGTALTIDASSDQNALSTNQEILTSCTKYC